MSDVTVQVVVDCREPEALADFWAGVLGYEKQWTWDEATVAWMREGGLPESDIGSRAAIFDPEGKRPRMFFQRVPEDKAVKNRIHLDMHVGAERMDAEVERIVALGATVVGEHRFAYGPLPEEHWFVLQDPEGNEFCVT